MRFRLLALLVVLVGVPSASSRVQAQDMANYYQTGDFLGAPPASFREGLLGYANPAVPAMTGSHFVAAWSTKREDVASVRDWGLFSNLGGLGLSTIRRSRGSRSLTGYHASLAGGSDAAAFGVGYQGYSGDATALGRYNRLTAGTIVRPTPYLSVGFTGIASLETTDREVVGEIGIRPLGTSRITLFADASWGEGDAIDAVPWSAGAAIEVVPGLDLRSRIFDSDAVSVGLRLELGQTGLDSESQIDPNGSYARQVNRVRLGSYEPSAVSETVQKGEKHVQLKLQGRVPYRQNRLQAFFGEGPPRFYEVLRTIRYAGESQRVAAVAVNLSGLQVTPEQAWELRSALQTAQDAGTSVVTVLESGGMTTYHLASVADVVALDPQGTLALPGYAASRTFLKGTLNKLGLGVQPWRFFEYKSAFEQFSRTEFSRADSLQRKAYVDDQYELTQTDVAGARPFAPDSLDRLIDRKTVLTAQEALDAGLVDTLARWNERSDLLASVTQDETSSLGARGLNEIATASRRWGPRPEIAVVYGLGTTQVTSGMESRTLSKKIRTLAKDDGVAAVVFRVDSPGGSPVAAAQVGDAIRACAKKKPVIVSQGQVAASGGYWVSTFADTIVAGPNTVTGSIGVIGGWIYDESFSDKTGLSTDVVQRGARADLFQGLRLPLVGLSVPTRKLNDEELSRVEDVIQQGYTEFVSTVAKGRDTTETYIRSIAEGRIYSGRDGKSVGLVDEIGGLPRALEIARKATGRSAAEIEVREVNPESEFRLSSLLPSPIDALLGQLGSDASETRASPSDPTMTFIRLMLEHQPHPLVLLPPNAYPHAK